MLYDGSSLMAVFDAIAACGEITRARISEMTGFSQVTVGKAVELLDACGIISQYKQERASAGRKTGVCRLEPDAGMILFEFAEMKLRVTDVLMEIQHECSFESPETAFMTGFSAFSDYFDGELMGVGCIVPDRKLDEYRGIIIDAFGNEPELVIEAAKSAAVANSGRFDPVEAAVYLRISGGSCSGALMLGGQLYGGVSGRAGDFARLIPDVSALPEKLLEICALLDPELIHIAADVPVDFDVPPQTQLVVEPLSACRDALDGAAWILRERWVTSKIANIG